MGRRGWWRSSRRDDGVRRVTHQDGSGKGYTRRVPTVCGIGDPGGRPANKNESIPPIIQFSAESNGPHSSYNLPLERGGLSCLRFCVRSGSLKNPSCTVCVASRAWAYNPRRETPPARVRRWVAGFLRCGSPWPRHPPARQGLPHHVCEMARPLGLGQRLGTASTSLRSARLSAW